jgi:hypothetical protein
VRWSLGLLRDALILMSLVALLSVVFLYACTAKADTGPQFGGCIRAGAVCFGPAAVITVGKYQGGKFSAGVMPGACYEATAWPDKWHSVGLSVCGQLTVGGNEANQGTASGLISFANWFRFGAGAIWTEQPSGPAQRGTAILFGLGTMFGGSPAYVQAVAK